MNERQTDILIVGGGVGGCAAALAVASMGRQVVITEETDWLGGQLTSQAVPPDENPWIEKGACTRRWTQFREGVRQYYRDWYPLTAAARNNVHLNPGNGSVSRLCHEPRVAVAVIEQMMAYDRCRGNITVLYRHKPVAVDMRGDMVGAVTLLDLDTGNETTITAAYTLDATELGDLLPLAGVEYVSGSESQAETGEPHALPGDSDPDDVQSFTWCFPMAYDSSPGASHVIDKPATYDFWRNYVPTLQPAWTGPLLDWITVHPITLGPVYRVLFAEDQPAGATVASSALWRYRRIITSEHFAADDAPHETTVVNWPQNDYWEGNVIDKPADVVATHLEASRQLSLSFFYWLQTEAPRGATWDGQWRYRDERGYPELYLRPDLTGTTDGLAMAPYFRESRRIRAAFTVTENHVGTEARAAAGFDHATPFEDSVGIGCYRIDLHPSTAGRNYVDIASRVFQIPLGALIPQRVENLLPACKNLGVTHITNGCYRLHPVEWNIGEAAGLLAAHCMDEDVRPREVHANPKRLQAFQSLCRAQGFTLEWAQPDGV